MATATVLPGLPQPTEAELLTELAKVRNNPMGFVCRFMPWGLPGALQDEEGPDTWQVNVLERIRAHCLYGQGGLRIAVASGHGVGKSALVAWLILWFISTRSTPQIVVTANTSIQLSSKTWREVAKWLRLSWLAPYLEWTATRLYHKDYPDTWFASAVPWSANRPEAFAGTHERHVLALFDEASAIDDIIWETMEGAMTTAGSMWFAFGNPTRNTGRFRQCFPGGRFAHRWQTLQVDSRTAKMADQIQINEWLTDYGIDSDFCKVRILGTFPSQAIGQFISEASVSEALERPDIPDPLAPTVIGVDVARYGDDRSVIVVRQGGRLPLLHIYREIDTVRLAGYVCETIDQYRGERPVTCIDAVGLGAGVVDFCRARGYRVEEVLGGQKPQEPEHSHNKVAECWQGMRTWLETRASLDASQADWIAELCGREYDFDVQGRLRLEGKEAMKKRGLASPDVADALSLTFAVPLAALQRPRAKGKPREFSRDWRSAFAG